MNIITCIRQKVIMKYIIIQKIMCVPIRARHAEYSILFSSDDDNSKPSEYLINVSLNAINKARTVSLDDICEKMKTGPYWPNVWPGEHYKLLAGFIAAILEEYFFTKT